MPDLNKGKIYLGDLLTFDPMESLESCLSAQKETIQHHFKVFPAALMAQHMVICS